MSRKILILGIILAIVGVYVAGAFIIMDLTSSEAEIAIISDLHIYADSYIDSNEKYNENANLDKMIHLSEAITKTIVDEIIDNKKIKTVLVTGDMTEDGDNTSQLAAAKILRRLEDAGKEVFIINGNHDAPSSADKFPNDITTQQFREIYSDFGYSEAIIRDDKSLSYVAEINRKFRLIAIDNDNYYSTDTDTEKEEMDERLIAWSKEQVIQCINDGKTPLVITHKPLLVHYSKLMGQLLGEELVTESFGELANVLADNGADYVFTGHNHGNDIASMTTENGNKIYDIETSSTEYYPATYRTVSITKDDLNIRVHNIDNINMDYISEFCSAEDYEMIKNDFREYARNHCKEGLTILNKISGPEIVGALGLTGTMADALNLVIDNAVLPVFALPLYIKDTNSGLSVEKIITDNGGTIPVSEYKSLEDVVAYFVMTINSGNENVSLDSVELNLLTCGVKVIFYYINSINDEINALFSDTPLIEINLSELFGSGELEVIDSNLIAFFVKLFNDKLPSLVRNIEFYNLDFIKSILPSFIPGIGEDLILYLGSKEIYFDLLIQEYLYSNLMADLLLDEFDTNVIIDRETLRISPLID